MTCEEAVTEVMKHEAELARAVMASCNCGRVGMPTPEVTWAEEDRVRAQYEATVMGFIRDWGTRTN